MEACHSPRKKKTHVEKIACRDYRRRERLGRLPDCDDRLKKGGREAVYSWTVSSRLMKEVWRQWMKEESGLLIDETCVEES